MSASKSDEQKTDSCKEFRAFFSELRLNHPDISQTLKAIALEQKSRD